MKQTGSVACTNPWDTSVDINSLVQNGEPRKVAEGVLILSERIDDGGIHSTRSVTHNHLMQITLELHSLLQMLSVK